DALSVPVHATADKTTYGVDLSIEDGRAHVIEGARQRSTRPPPVGRGVVFHVIGAGEAKHAAAHDVKLSVGGRHRDLRKRGWKRSFDRPASLRLGVCGRDRQSKQRASGSARPQHSNPILHSLLPYAFSTFLNPALELAQ